MSRIGKLPISIPAGVTVGIDNNVVTVKGPKGELTQTLHSSIAVTIENDEVVLSRNSDDKQERAYHGLYRALINNMVIGVSGGYSKQMELVGVGFRAATQPGNILELNLGFTHSILLKLPSQIKVEAKSERNKNPLILLESCDKHLLGQVCAKIRSFRKPEPYKGKGVKFVGEEIRRKSGKAAAAK